MNVLNNIAGSFFGWVQINLIENTALRIARLTDPSKQGKNSNLTLELLKEHGEKKKMFGVGELRLSQITRSIELIEAFINNFCEASVFEKLKCKNPIEIEQILSGEHTRIDCKPLLSPPVIEQYNQRINSIIIYDDPRFENKVRNRE